MAFLFERPALTLFLLIAITQFNIEGQTSDVYSVREKEADSLALLEKHEEAVEILMSVIEENGRKLMPDDLLRLEYKTGYSLMQSGHDIEASSYFRKVIWGEGSEKLNSGLINDAMTGLGKTHEYTGRHDSAFYWYLEAYKQVAGSNDTIRIARGARNMAQLLRVLKRFDEARLYCRKAVDLISGIKDYKVEANIYNETAYLFELSDNLDSAAFFYEQLINLSIANDYLKGESVGYSNLASVFEKQNRLKEALDLKLKGIEIDKEINDNYGLMTSFRGLSSTYLMTGDYDKALQAINKSHQLCDTSWLPDLSGIMMGYYEIYKAKGQFREALKYFEDYNIIRDSINQAESKKQVIELLSRYETEKKEQLIKILEQSNALKENKIHLLWIIVSAIILLSIAGIIISTQIIRNKNDRIASMILELRNYILLLKNTRSATNNSESTYDRKELLKEQFSFTEREAEIMNLIMDGLTNEEIAGKLFVSPNTIKFHIKNIYLKLDVKSRIQALLMCNNNSFD
ncbi:MAG: LuxR family transcriptional regulator [Bacteroidales bacterium]|nr:LuxR family transcriptional regulator [Bacteroidales bacterium]